MDLSLERDSTAIGSLFQQIVADMKNTSPLWEDFIAKASKLHACLRAAIQAIAAYLDAFQKIADAATNSRGACKEIGTALTRVCLRHKAVETRMKTFTSAIMDCLIVPLQDKLEDWKRQVVSIDKEHAKEYKRCRTELKKRSSDTLRLQKKARKGQSDTIQSLVDSHMQDVSLRRAELEDVERKSLRAAMIEERMRYCNFVYMLQPVVKEECEVMSELGHLQEAMQSIAIVTKEPNILPQSSEELILESKSTLNLYPESPGGGSGSQGCSNSLGSRKSSVCSISSMNSSGSSGSPGHHHYQRSLSQLISPAIRLKPGESSDSGFCSSPALTSQASTTTSQSHAVSTWPPHSQDVVQTTDRPHTISTAYEKGHQRPALTVYTFQNPETIIESQKSPAAMACRPPLPVRCSSLERPISSPGMRNPNVTSMQRQCPSPIPVHITKELPVLQPTYVNMSELASMAASKITNQQLFQQQSQKQQQPLQQLQSQKQLQHQQQQPNSPNQSTTSSQMSSDSSMSNSHQLHSLSDLSLTGTPAISTSSTATQGATTPPSNGDSPPSMSQNNSPLLTTNTNLLEIPLTGSGDNNTETNIDDELKITETDSTFDTTSNTTCNNSGILSPENDISRASVLQKTSMFEKLEQKQQSVSNNLPTMTTTRSSHIINTEFNFANKKDEIYKCTETNEKDPGCVSRITRRSSINSIKPPPPVRRSSSVTPSHNLTMASSPNLIQQNIMNTSADVLPPPPAFLLDRAGNSSPTINVAETVKALTVIRHTPASPSVLRRAQNQTPTIQSYRTSNSTSPGIYAQPKQVSKMSSFRTPSPNTGPQKTSSSLLAQLNARLMPSKQNQQPQPSMPNDYSIYQQNSYQENRNNQSMNVQQTYSSGSNSPHHQAYTLSGQIYSHAEDQYYYGIQQYNQQQQPLQQNYDDYSPSNIDKSGSMRSKTKAEFLENLNAKLAKQGLSGRAFAVRNLINSKALRNERFGTAHNYRQSAEPDPRLCHESLMDQIKRGATLKRNRTINDRSAPKIH